MYTPLQRFFRMLQPNKRAISHLYIFAFANGLIALSLPLGIQAIINLIQGGEISASWVVLVTIVILGFIITGALQIVQMRITEDLQRDVFTRSAFEFAYRLPKIKMGAMSKYYAPELMNRFFDTISIQKGLAKILLEFSTAGFQILFGLILLSFYHSFFVLFSFLILFLVYIIGTYIFKRGVKSSIVESKYKYKVAFWLEEMARTFTTFKMEQKSPIPLRNTDSLVLSYLTSRETHFKILLRQYYLFITFKVLVATGFLVLGGILVFNQQMNIGQFVAAEIIVLLLIQSSEKMLLALENIYDLLTSVEKIGEVTDLELEDIDDNTEVFRTETGGMSIDVNGLQFSYPDGDDQVLHHVSFSVKPNERIGLTGSSGSGKMTLVKILLGFYKGTGGSLAYDGQPIDQYNIGALRDKISLCFNETKVFDGTILENLTMGKEFDSDRLFKVLEITNLAEHLAEFPEGLNTPIGPHGHKLSGAMMQKILLSRCLLKKSRLYIIEDVLKNVLLFEKLHIFKNLLSFLQGSTVILVTKEQQLLALTDAVLELDGGRNKSLTKLN
jgi:ABC-type bacteriocin/lantibiotic exporter with double-glycine peptidase domain